MIYKLIWRLIYDSLCILGNWNLLVFFFFFFRSLTHTLTQYTNIKHYQPAKVHCASSRRIDSTVPEGFLEVILTRTDAQRGDEIIISV